MKLYEVARVKGKKMGYAKAKAVLLSDVEVKNNNEKSKDRKSKH